MTIKERIANLMRDVPSDNPYSFESIILRIGYVKPSSPMLMAIYRAFRECIHEGYIVRLPDNSKDACKYVRRMYYGTGKIYEKKKKAKNLV